MNGIPNAGCPYQAEDGYNDRNRFPPGHLFIGEIENGKRYPLMAYTKTESDARYAPIGTETDIAALNAEVAGKADQTDLDELTETVAGKASAADLAATEAAVALKADTADVNAALAGKADASDVSTALAAKADIADVNSALSGKADTSDVNASLALINTSLASKASASSVNAALAGKADKAETEAALEAKADAASVAADLAEKADAADLETANALIATKADSSAVNAALAEKADADAVESALEAKADAADVTEALAGKASTTTTDGLQAQINELITPVTQDAEVQNARVGEDGETYETLKERLDSENAALRESIDGIDEVIPKVNAAVTDGGINIFDVLSVSHGKFLDSSTGAETDDAKYDASAYIPISGSTTYTIRTFTFTGQASYRIYYYDASKNFISPRLTRRCDADATGFVFTTPSTARYIRLNFETDQNPSGTQDAATCILERGNLQIAEYIPYYTACDGTARKRIDEVAATVGNVSEVKPKVDQSIISGGINIFDLAGVERNVMLDSTTGAEIANTNYNASGFIPVDAGALYSLRTFTYTGLASYRIYYYDANKDFISRTTARCSQYPAGFVFTTPSTCSFVRLNFESSTNADGTQDETSCTLETGNHPIAEYSPYYTAIDGEARKRINAADAKLESMSTVKPRVDQSVAPGGVNIFDVSKVVYGKTINGSTGAESDNPNYNISDWITVTPGGTYSIRTFDYTGLASYRIHYYDANKDFISRLTARCNTMPVGFVFTAPADCAFIKLGFESSVNTDGTQDANTCTLEAGNHPITEYTPYYTAVDSVARKSLGKVETITDELTAVSTIALFPNVASIGDSFSAGYCYNKPESQWYDPNYIPNGEYPLIAYPAVMGRLYGVNVTPFAKGGLTTGTWRTDAAGLPALLAADPQDLYIIALGLNDRTQNIPIGEEEDIDTEPETQTVLGNMGAIIRAIIGHAPGCRIILCKSLWVYNAGESSPNAYYNYISEFIEILSAHTGIPYIETLGDAYLCSDAYVNGFKGLHPTPPLYAGLGKRMGELVGKCIIDNPQYFYNYYKQ